MDRDLAGFEEAVADPQPVAATVLAGAAGVRDGLVDVDTQREIALEELVRHIGERRPERMSVRAVAEGLARDAAEGDLVELVPLAVLVVSRVHEVRAVREAGAAHEVRVALTEQARKNVENATERVGAAGERGRLQRLEQASRWDAHFHEVVEAVVKEDLRVEDHDHVDAGEHLEHLFVQQEIDRRDRLRVGTREVEDALITLAPHRTLDAVGAHVQTVIADVVLEELLGLRDVLADQHTHRTLVALEHGVHR